MHPPACSLSRSDGSKAWGFSFNRLRRSGFILTPLHDGGDLGCYLDK